MAKYKVISATVWKVFEGFHSTSSLRIMGPCISISVFGLIKSRNATHAPAMLGAFGIQTFNIRPPVGMRLLQVIQKLTGLADHITNFHCHSSFSLSQSQQACEYAKMNTLYKSVSRELN
jgi:hypothetical protein